MITIEDAHDAVEKFDGLLFFDKVSPAIRADIADVLVRLVNMQEGDKRESNLRYQKLAFVTPEERLKKFVRLVTTKSAGTWMGIPQLIALYATQFIAADPELVVNPEFCTVPGFTADEYADNIHATAIEAPREQAYLPQPGDEPIGDDIHEKIKQLVVAKSVKAK